MSSSCLSSFKNGVSAFDTEASKVLAAWKKAAFCKQAEERLWRPHFSRGEPAKALTAVLEAVENRAREKKPPPAQRADGGLGTDVLGGQSE